MTIILPPKWEIPLSLGFSVFPLPPQLKRPIIKWKPYQTEIAPRALVKHWSDQHPDGNVAIATGALSGVIGFDMDNEEAVLRAYERGLPDTLLCRTPRGIHAFFKHPGGRVSNSAEIEPGWDLRGDGGFLVAAGSYYVPTPAERAAGKVEGRYEWVDATKPLLDAPEWVYAGHRHEILARVPIPPVEYRGDNPYGPKGLENELAILRGTSVGAGLNMQIFKSASAIAQLVAGGWLDEEPTWTALEEAIGDLGDNPAKDLDSLSRGWNAGIEQPREAGRQDAQAVLGDGPAPVMPAAAILAPVPSPPSAVHVGPRERPSVLSASQFPEYFEGVTYINGRDEFFTPQGQFLRRSAFDGTYGGPTFMLGSAGTGPSKSASDAFLKNETVQMPRANAVCFRPEVNPGKIMEVEGLKLLNCYVPIEVPRVEGDATPFINHVKKMLPDEHDQDILFHYMASLVQNIGVKFQWWPVLQGTKGNGKTLLITVLSYCIGDRYTHLVNPEAMVKTSNQFNDWITNTLFIGIEEARTKDGRRDLLELLKPIVTNRKVAVEGKGLKQTKTDNRANGMALTNYQDAMPIDDDERRYAIFFTAQQSVEDMIRDGMNEEYFSDLYDWLDNQNGLAITYDWLMRFTLRPELDPARKAKRAPYTSSTKLAVTAGRGAIEQAIIDAIEEGLPGFVGGLINSKAVMALADKMRRSVTNNRLRSIMQSIGYDWHPALPQGRCTVVVQGAHSGKPKLYAAKDGPHWNIGEAIEVVETYNALQAEGSLG